MSDLKLTLTDEQYAKIVSRERNYLGFGPDVAALSDLEVLRKGVARTRRVMRRCVKGAAPAVANDAVIQFHDTQLAFNIARERGE